MQLSEPGFGWYSPVGQGRARAEPSGQWWPYKRTEMTKALLRGWRDINNKQHGTSFSGRDTVRKTIRRMEKGRTGKGIQWKREYRKKE